MPTNVNPPIDPLPTSTSTYRDGQGRQRRLRVVAVPKKFDPRRFAEVLIAAAMERVDRQRQVERGEIKLLPAPTPREH